MHLARVVARSEPPASGAVLRRWLRWRLTAAGLALGITAVGAAVWSADTAVAIALVLLVATWLIGALTEFLNHFFRGLSRTDIESTIALVSRLVTLVAGAAALAWRPTLMPFAAALLLTAVLTFAVSLRTAARLTGSALLARIEPGPAHRRREFLRDVAPVGVGVVLSALYFRVDVLLLQHWRGAEAVGAYSAVFRLIEALRLFPAAALAVALPELCRAESTRPMIRLATRLGGGAVVLAGAIWLAAGWLIPFCFGPAFADAVPAFRILLIAFPLMTLNYALTTQLVAWDRHRAYAALCAAALVLNVALNARLIPAQSIVGAAWTTVWTEVWLTLGCTIALAGFSERRTPGLSQVASS